jgi:hypothetical protein
MELWLSAATSKSLIADELLAHITMPCTAFKLASGRAAIHRRRFAEAKKWTADRDAQGPQQADEETVDRTVDNSLQQDHHRHSEGFVAILEEKLSTIPGSRFRVRR